MNWLNRFWQTLTGSSEEPTDEEFEQKLLIPQSRAIDVYDIMQQIVYSMRENTDLEGSYYDYYPTRLLYDEKQNSLYCVFNHKGRLLRADVDFSGGLDKIKTGPMVPVVETHTPLPSSEDSDVQRNKVLVHRQKDGKLRVTMVSSTAVLNRVNEIDSTKLFDKFIERSEASGFYPMIDIHHLTMGTGNDIFDIGQIDMSMRAGVAYIQSGIIDESKKLGKLVAKSLEKGDTEWGCSIEYWPLDKQTITVAEGINVDVYVDGINTRTTLLPEECAASWFTSAIKTRQIGESEEMLTDDQRKTLRALFSSEEEFNTFLASVDGVNREVGDKNLIHRNAETKTEPVTPPADTQPVAENNSQPSEIVLDDELVGVIVNQVVERMSSQEDSVGKALLKIAENIQGLSAQVNGMTQRQEKFEQTVANRLTQLEQDEDAQQEEILSQIPVRVKDRMTIKYRPSQGGQNQNDAVIDRSFDDIAANTLANIPGPV